VSYNRRTFRNKQMAQAVTKLPDLNGVLVLELFPGAGLFGRAFESLGACVVRGPDILWGGDIRNFKGRTDAFDVVIGGPPCQTFSRAAINGTKAVNLIPEFVRVVEECRPKIAVMENVREARAAAPEWDYTFVRDWDCGGLTHRRRGFWFYGCDAPLQPNKRPGQPEYSVLASSWNKRGMKRMHGHTGLAACEAARLQGFNGLDEKIKAAQPGWITERSSSGLSERAREVLAVHMLGNGVPMAMGLFVARHVALCLMAQKTKIIELKTDLKSLNQLVVGSNPTGVTS
jgi:site-specific DNA-cytosine methylase